MKTRSPATRFRHDVVCDRRWRPQRERDAECSAHADFALEPDPAAMRLHELLGQGETEAGALPDWWNGSKMRVRSSAGTRSRGPRHPRACTGAWLRQEIEDHLLHLA